jgi:hypothetical protein
MSNPDDRIRGDLGQTTGFHARTSVNLPSAAIVSWRMERLVAAGLPAPLAHRVAADSAYDLHEFLSLVDRGCPPELAVRILAPLRQAGRPR